MLISRVVLAIFVCGLSACGFGVRAPGHVYTTANIVQTSRSGDKLAEIGSVQLGADSNGEFSEIALEPDSLYQTILGFGGSFTESTAFVLNQLSAERRSEVIRAYFGPDGAAYSLTRTHMNSSDFSLGNYSYAKVPDDTTLDHFTIEEDLDDIVPLIKDAMAVSKDGFEIVASPWTAPPWMKDNNEWNGGSLKPEYYSTWAHFFSKYLRAYEAEGIPIWGVTIENEPLGNDAHWESMIFTPETMRDFLKDHLGPRLRSDGLDTRILIYDQNRDHLDEWVDTILNDKTAAKYVWGTAVHWYSSTVEWYPETLKGVHRRFPDKKLLHTEGTIDSEVPVWQDDDWYWRVEATDWGYDWAPPEDKHLHPKYVPVYRYARDIIGGLNSWLVGWIDWNMVLDTGGGPNHANNWCIAPVIAKPETDEVYYTPLFHTLAHFSKYIRPNARRIKATSDASGLMVTAFRNQDMSIAVVVLNQTDEAVRYRTRIREKSSVIEIPGNALQTLVLR